jgi:hypothetical protein
MKWWEEDPKAVEAVEYLLEIGFNSEEFLHAEMEASGDGEQDEDSEVST